MIAPFIENLFFENESSPSRYHPFDVNLLPTIQERSSYPRPRRIVILVVQYIQRYSLQTRISAEREAERDGAAG